VHAIRSGKLEATPERTQPFSAVSHTTDVGDVPRIISSASTYFLLSIKVVIPATVIHGALLNIFKDYICSRQCRQRQASILHSILCPSDSHGQLLPHHSQKNFRNTPGQGRLQTVAVKKRQLSSLIIVHCIMLMAEHDDLVFQLHVGNISVHLGANHFPEGLQIMLKIVQIDFCTSTVAFPPVL